MILVSAKPFLVNWLECSYPWDLLTANDEFIEGQDKRRSIIAVPFRKCAVSNENYSPRAHASILQSGRRRHGTIGMGEPSPECH